MKIVYIFRGLPGAGKSTAARALADTSADSIIHSTDDFFMQDGVYKFDPSKLPRYHAMNFNAFCNSLRSGIETIIVDNTNSQRWEWEKYENAALKADYAVAIVSLPMISAEEAAARTLHNVPVDVIKKMIARWEDSPTDNQGSSK